MFLPKCIQQRACLLQAQGKDRRLPPATAAQAGSAIAIAAAVARSRATAKRGTSGRCDRKRQCAKSSASATSVTAPSKTTLASQSCQSPASTSAPPAQRLASSSFTASDDDDPCTAERHSSGGGSSSEGSSTPSGRSSCDGSGSGTGSEVEEGPKVESPVSPSLVSSSDEEASSRDAAHQGPMPTCRVVSKLSCTDPYTCLEVVEVPQPDGTCSPALLMTLLRKHKVTGKPRRKPDNRTPLLLQHLERQAAAHKALGGSPNGVRLLWQSRPGRESDAHVLLLSFEFGAVGLDSFMDDLAMDETQREFDAMLAKPKPEKPRRQNPSSSNKTTGKTATPLPAPPPALVLTGRTLVPEPLLKRIAVALLSALATLHEAGICHGAIAPDCVSVVTASSTEPTPSIGSSSSTQFLVTSCGLAAPVDAAGVVEQRRMRVKGSALEYAAPEVRAHLAAARSGCVVDSEVAVPVVTVACDVASAGLLLLDAAAFRATAGGLRAYTEGRMGLPARLPQGLRDLVARLTAADASQRPSAREALAHPYLQGL